MNKSDTMNLILFALGAYVVYRVFFTPPASAATGGASSAPGVIAAAASIPA